MFTRVLLASPRRFLKNMRMNAFHSSIALGLLLLCTSTAAMALPPATQTTSCDHEGSDTCADFKEADDELNKEYHVIYEYEHHRHALKAMEAAWIQYRDAQCDWEVSPSAASEEKMECLTAKTRLHTAHLKKVAHCGTDPYDCDDSAKGNHE